MLTVHHLGKSQSERIVWLCEELEIPYELKCYTRDAVTMLAPAHYKALHPIGAAPVITDGELVLAESGAVVEYIIAKYGNGRLALNLGHPDFAHFLYWFHFANGTLQANMGRNMILNRLKLAEDNAILAATTKFRKEAQINGVRPVNVNNFLAYMGYRPVRKTQGLGEEDIYRQTIQAQKTRRIQPNPGDVSAEDEGIDVERVKRNLAGGKGGKKGEAGAAKTPKKDASGDLDDDTPKKKKGDKGKKDDASGDEMDGKEKKEIKKGKKKGDDDGF